MKGMIDKLKIVDVKDKASFRNPSVLMRSPANLAMSLFSRHCAWRRTHPMSGGIMRVRLDGVDVFLSLRKEAFGFELAPLPRSLQLPITESRLTPPRQPARAFESATGS